jgi:hypothetical protein
MEKCVLPYKLANKQHGPKRWGGGCNTPRQLVIGSWCVTPTTPPLRPVLLIGEFIRYVPVAILCNYGSTECNGVRATKDRWIEVWR